MPPELVIADAPFKKYPGGVIAIKADEWIAGARGTLTSGSDPLSCTGTYVEDSQTVTTSLSTDPWDAYAEAENTLEIDLSVLGLETFLPYVVHISAHILGEWDVTNLPALFSSTQDTFGGFAAISFHAEDSILPEEEAEIVDRLLGRQSYYSMVTYGGASFFPEENPGILEIRAYAQAGTTISIRLDQIIIFPSMHASFGSPINGWDTEDFQVVHAFGENVLLSAPDDGADGGDENGKFTLVHELSDSQAWATPGADYQEKTDGDDAEYLSHVNVEDNETIENTLTGNEPKVYCYGGHGARHKTSRVHTFDDFSRTIAMGSTGDKWGTTPEGYGWTTGSGTSEPAGVNGSVGVLRVNGPVIAGTSTGVTASLRPYPIAPTTGAEFDLNDYYSITGKWRFVPTVGWLGAPPPPSAFGTNATVNVGEIQIGSGYSYRFRLYSQDVLIGEWDFGYWETGVGAYVVLATGSISSFGDGVEIGFRIEKDRYRVRARHWDVLGGEPSGWDFDDWRVIFESTAVAYPYGDDAEFSRQVYINRFFSIQLIVANNAQDADLQVDDFEVSYDPDGETPVDTFVRLERPEGTTLGEITIPWGAHYVVYWGKGDFTEEDSGEFKLTFSTKHWNDSGKPMLQRGENLWWWFRSIHGRIPIIVRYR